MAGRKPSAGMTVLAVYLLLAGLARIIHLHFIGLPAILGALAVTAGILILLGR